MRAVTGFVSFRVSSHSHRALARCRGEALSKKTVSTVSVGAMETVETVSQFVDCTYTGLKPGENETKPGVNKTKPGENETKPGVNENDF
jgi:hypothetical protein